MSCWFYLPSPSQVCTFFSRTSSLPTSVQAPFALSSDIVSNISVLSPSNLSSVSLPKEFLPISDHVTPWITHHLDKIQTPQSSGLYLQPHPHHLPECTLWSSSVLLLSASRTCHTASPYFNVCVNCPFCSKCPFPICWPDKFLFASWSFRAALLCKAVSALLAPWQFYTTSLTFPVVRATCPRPGLWIPWADWPCLVPLKIPSAQHCR